MGDHRVGRRIPVRTVKTFGWGAVLVLAAGLIVAELAMDLTATDRQRLYLVFGAMATVTLRRALRFFVLDTPGNSLFDETDVFLESDQPLDDYRKSLTPFLPATVFLAPFRVRAFVLVR